MKIYRVIGGWKDKQKLCWISIGKRRFLLRFKWWKSVKKREKDIVNVIEFHFLKKKCAQNCQFKFCVVSLPQKIICLFSFLQNCVCFLSRNWMRQQKHKSRIGNEISAVPLFFFVRMLNKDFSIDSCQRLNLLEMRFFTDINIVDEWRKWLEKVERNSDRKE